jgi:hypothetical protein
MEATKMEIAQNSNPHVTMTAEQESANIVELMRKILTILAFSGLEVDSHFFKYVVGRYDDLDDSLLYFSFDEKGSHVGMSVSIQLEAPNVWNKIAVTSCKIEKSDGSEWERIGVRAALNMSSSGDIFSGTAAVVAKRVQMISEFLSCVEQLNVPNDHAEATYICKISAEQKKLRIATFQRDALRKKIATAAYNKFDGKYPKQRGSIKSFYLKELGIERADYSDFVGTKFTFGSPCKKITHSFEIIEAVGGAKVFVERIELDETVRHRKESCCLLVQALHS